MEWLQGKSSNHPAVVVAVISHGDEIFGRLSHGCAGWQGSTNCQGEPGTMERGGKKGIFCRRIFFPTRGFLILVVSFSYWIVGKTTFMRERHKPTQYPFEPPTTGFNIPVLWNEGSLMHSWKWSDFTRKWWFGASYLKTAFDLRQGWSILEFSETGLGAQVDVQIGSPYGIIMSNRT